MSIRHWFSIAVTILSFATSASASLEDELQEIRIPNFSVEEVPLETALMQWRESLGETTEFSIAYTDDSLRTRPVTIILRSLAAQHVLEFTLSSAGCRYVINEGIVLIEVDTDDGSHHSDELSNCPSSIVEAIEMLDQKLPEEQKTQLREMKEDGLANLHMSLGLGIRNGFCLWNRTGLTDEMARTYLVGDADEMSTLLIGIYWSHLTNPKFDLKVHLNKRREDAIKTLKQDLIDTRKKLKAIEEEREELRAIEQDIIELLKDESELTASGQSR